MASMNRIVVGYDGSAEAKGALVWATSRAEMTGASLHVVQVTPPELAVGLAGRGMGLSEAAREATGLTPVPVLTDAKERLGQARVTSEGAIGNPTSQLVEASRSADLVVVGSRGRGALMAGLFGSTSYAVAAHSECPVVVVRSPKGAEAPVVPDASHPVVVGVEDLETSKGAMDRAAAMATEYMAPVRLVRATPVVQMSYVMTDGGAATAEVMKEVIEDDKAALQECAGYLRSGYPGVPVEAVHVESDPAHAVVENAEDAGLIVVGSRGRGGFKGLMLGSVSHAVIHLSECPVLVVRQ